MHLNPLYTRAAASAQRANLVHQSCLPHQPSFFFYHSCRSFLNQCHQIMTVHGQARKAQRKNFSHTDARLREIKRDNNLMVNRLAHVSTSQDQSPPPQALVSSVTLLCNPSAVYCVLLEIFVSSVTLLCNPSTVYCVLLETLVSFMTLLSNLPTVYCVLLEKFARSGILPFLAMFQLYVLF